MDGRVRTRMRLHSPPQELLRQVPYRLQPALPPRHDGPEGRTDAPPPPRLLSRVGAHQGWVPRQAQDPIRPLPQSQCRPPAVAELRHSRYPPSDRHTGLDPLERRDRRDRRQIPRRQTVGSPSARDSPPLRFSRVRIELAVVGFEQIRQFLQTRGSEFGIGI